LPIDRTFWQFLQSGILPLEKVGPKLRRSAKQAVASGDDNRARRVARAIVTELIRHGDLVQVAMENSKINSGPFCLVRGNNKLIDLSVFNVPSDSMVATTEFLQNTSSLDDAMPRQEELLLRGHPSRFESFDEVLRAMEQAQHLGVGDPLSSNKSFILDGILSLLGTFLSGLRLYLMLPRGEETLPGKRLLFIPGEGKLEPAWLAERSPQSSAWLTSGLSLPWHIQNDLRLAAGGRSANNKLDDLGFQASVAVPLYSPPIAGDVDSGRGVEAGVIFLIPKTEINKPMLFKMGHRLSRFVTRRWHEKREVNQQIHTDSLTGVYNRKYFDVQFGREVERARRRKSPLTLVIGDLDNFKLFNDTYGHQSGDRVLQLVAHHLLKELRRIDHVCRIGGEEFALILPHTSTAAAQEVLSRLVSREVYLEIEAAPESERVPITMSFGAVTFPDGGQDAFELYRKADSMLYLSKERGRNQCHFWHPDEQNHLTLYPQAGED